jgi:glycosyltransferase involved in cell wall biosynthesis
MTKNNLKVAIVHDYLKEYGGAERVVEKFLNIWPDASLYTSVFLPEYSGPHRKRLEKWKIKTSVLQKIPFKAKLISMFRFVAPLIFFMMDLRKYDLIIVSSAGTYTSPNFIRRKKGSLLITYYHTPPRYLYGYPVANDWTGSFFRRVLFFLGRIPMFFLRKLDRYAAQLPDYVIANSHEVAGRIKKFYGREAEIIYPPVEIPEIKEREIVNNKRNYFLIGGRISRHKGFDIAVKAFTKLRYPLKVFGGTFASYGTDQFKSFAGNNIEFLGEVGEDEKWKLMKSAKAFIFPSEAEDFGIIPVEAMAVGTPVIALKQGGQLETVVDGLTGIFFEDRTPESLIAAVKEFEKKKFDPRASRLRAKDFSAEKFKTRMLQFIEKKL